MVLEAGWAQLATLLLCVTLARAEVTREFDSAGPSNVAHSCGWRVGCSSWLGTQPDFALVFLCVLSLKWLGPLPAWQLVSNGQGVNVASPLKAQKTWHIPFITYSIAQS